MQPTLQNLPTSIRLSDATRGQYYIHITILTTPIDDKAQINQLTYVMSTI